MSDRAFEHLLWRASLRKGPAFPRAEDLIAWAPHFADDADLLRDCAALLQGFSAELAAQRARGDAPADAGIQATPPAGEWTLEIAIRELEETARSLSGNDAPSLIQPSRPRPSGRPDSPVGIGPGIPAGALPGDLGETARALAALLGRPGEADQTIATLLDSLIEAGRRMPEIDYRRHAAAPLALLASTVAAQCLIDFALGLRDLCGGPLGSPALLHRSARFASAGLGPYFSSVGRIARHSRDVFDLARIARAASGRTDDDSLAAWIVLLSRGCPPLLLREIIDDLADHGAMAPLSAILDRSLSRRPATIDVDLVMYLRDAALDNADYPLAAWAQSAIARLQPHSALEQEILGAIHASGGNLVEAAAALRASLSLAPGHPGVLARLEALGTPAFAPFILAQGFHSPADRLQQRLHRRGVQPSYPRRRGARIPAVDVS